MTTVDPTVAPKRYVMVDQKENRQVSPDVELTTEEADTLNQRLLVDKSLYRWERFGE